jgi:acyl carrier protein
MWDISLENIGPIHPDLALLLPTSGTTGEPKLVRLSHENIDSNARAISDYLQLSRDDRAITSLPWHYSYGLSVVHSTLASGGCLVLTDQSVGDPAFWTTFADHFCTSFAGVPYSFEILDRAGFLNRPAPQSLRHFTVAGGRLAPEKVKAFADWAAPQERLFYVMYGQTEASPRIAYLPPELAAEHPDCIGVPIPGGELRIAHSGGEQSVPGQAGELIYRGPNVMMGYAISGDDLAKGGELKELRTGDLAVQDANGLFRIVGRASRISKLFGLRISLDDLETRLREIGQPAWVAANDEAIVACMPEAKDASLAAATIADLLAIPPSVVYVIAGAGVPLLPSGKVDYASILAQALARAEAQTQAEARIGTNLSDGVAKLLNRASIDPRKSYIELGADSLTFVEASVLIEDQLGYLPPNWEKLPLQQLDDLAAGSTSDLSDSGARQVEAQIWLRAVAIIGVVASHVSSTLIGGGAYLLLLLSGMAFARFRAPLLHAGQIVSAFAPLLTRMVFAFYVVLLLYQLGRDDVDLRHWLLVGNLFPALQAVGKGLLRYYWFIPNYVQTLLLFCLLFAIPSYRAASKTRPWQVGVITLLAAFGVAMAAKIMVSFVPDQNTLASGRFTVRTPFFLFYIFAFGWCVQFATTKSRRLFLTIAAPLMFVTIGRTSYTIWLVLGAWAAIWLPAIALPRLAQRFIATVAASAFMIFIFHLLPVHALRVLWPGPRSYLFYLVGIVIGVAFGVAAKRSIDVIEHLAHTKLLRPIQARLTNGPEA